jgi:copper resistance protein D
MEIFSLFVRWLHVTAAVIWIGGNLTMAMVIVPYFKRSMSPVERIKILTQIGKGFEPVVWGCVLILIFTGLFNIFSAGIFGAESAELVNAFMRTLGIKLILVLLLIILTGVHGFIMGPRLAQAVETLESDAETLPTEIDKMRSQMAMVSSIIGVLSLLVLLAAVALRMGI